MYIKSITVYTIKSNRRNAKTKSKSLSIYKDSGYTNVKEYFTIYDIYDLVGFVLKSEYKLVRVTFNNPKGLFINYYSSHIRYSIEQVINDIYYAMEYLNFKEWNFTLAELHNDTNIRYLINQYYHGGDK